MKIDLSSLFLVVLVVIPGLLAQRSRSLMVPNILTPKGASEELADFVLLGPITHIVLILLSSFFALVNHLTAADLDLAADEEA